MASQTQNNLDDPFRAESLASVCMRNGEKCKYTLNDYMDFQIVTTSMQQPIKECANEASTLLVHKTISWGCVCSGYTLPLRRQSPTLDYMYTAVYIPAIICKKKIGTEFHGL